MKLRDLACILGALCSLLHAHAQPLPARQTTLPGTYRISVGTQLSYETPLAPLADYLREYINVGKASDSMSADDAIVLTTDPTLGREAYTLAVKPQRIEITGGDYGGVFNGIGYGIDGYCCEVGDAREATTAASSTASRRCCGCCRPRSTPRRARCPSKSPARGSTTPRASRTGA